MADHEVDISGAGVEQPRTGRRRAGGRASRPPKPWTWRRIVRWVANIMIICGVIGLPGYYLSTCAYTALQQRELRQNLEASHPQLTSVDASLGGSDFVPMAVTTTTTVSSATATTGSVTTVDPMAAAIAARDAQLAVLKAAADAFSLSVGGTIGKPIGKIVIPSIGVNVVMVEGTSKGDLKEGPGHWEETPFPGQGGNFVVSGHRTTYGAPFFKLNEIKVGDEIDIVLPYVVARYTVTETLIVYPDQVDTVASVGKEQVSLAACHPIYSAKQRIVIKGDLTSFKLIGSDGS